MRTALCTTTIHPCEVLDLYRACDSTAKQFVAVDEKTPDSVLSYLAGKMVTVAGSEIRWKCSEAIGWNTIARRNLAFLDALKDGTELIVSIDTDNIPISTYYFWNYQTIILRRFNGLCASSLTHWFDAGQLLFPWARHRGVPHGWHKHEYYPITNAKIGVMAGLVLGDSDVDATTRLEKPAGIETKVVSELARSGVVVSSCTHTVFNAQNVCLIRELVPAFFQMPGVGRHDDIYASLIVQRVARERELHVHFGLPLVYQQRHKHDLIQDLRAEIDGYEFVKPMAELLDQIVLKGKSVIEDTRTIYEKLRHASWIRKRAIDAAFLWLEDCGEAGCV